MTTADECGKIQNPIFTDASQVYTGSSPGNTQMASDYDVDAETPKSHKSRLATGLRSLNTLQQFDWMQKDKLNSLNEMIARKRMQPTVDPLNPKLTSLHPGNKAAISHISNVPNLNLGARRFSVQNGLPSARSIPNTSRAEYISQNAALRKEEQLKLYDGLETFEEASDCENDCVEETQNIANGLYDEDDEESIASLSTIAPNGYKVAPSVISLKMTARKKAIPGLSGMMQGATNILFEEGEDLGEEDEEFICNDAGSCELSLPMLVNMLKSPEIEMATSAATELALKIQRDPNIIKELSCIGKQLN